MPISDKFSWILARFSRSMATLGRLGGPTFIPVIIGIAAFIVGRNSPVRNILIWIKLPNLATTLKEPLKENVH